MGTKTKQQKQTNIRIKGCKTEEDFARVMPNLYNLPNLYTLPSILVEEEEEEKLDASSFCLLKNRSNH